jgi:protein-L-isoaspartate(D-aspartate) O-methyltransferase
MGPAFLLGPIHANKTSQTFMRPVVGARRRQFSAMENAADSSVEQARREYAEELCRRNQIASPEILGVFAKVPRERFVGPGPWIMQSEGEAWKTPDADPRHVYRDALIVLDAAKHLNNGQPSLWASHLALLGVRAGESILHLGCGTGYYTAILAELSGAGGKVTAIEIDQGLAYRARIALEPWPQVTVLHGDGARGPFEPVDAIVVSAGATHPLAAWLAAMRPEGKLVFPLTSTHGPGTMAHLARAREGWFHAALVSSAFFVDFEGARDERTNAELRKALQRDQGAGVRSLRCDAHERDQACWLHGEGWCFSRRPA